MRQRDATFGPFTGPTALKPPAFTGVAETSAAFGPFTGPTALKLVRAVVDCTAAEHLRPLHGADRIEAPAAS